jgi:hypothetical protein
MRPIWEWLRRLGRRLGPPGNRAPLDESYRQPGGGSGGDVNPDISDKR